MEDYASKEDQDITDSDWERGVGTSEFGKHLIIEDYAPYAGDMGMMIDLLGGPTDSQAMKFNKPKHASLTPETIQFYNDSEEEMFSVQVNFLGDDYLELRKDGICFAGILAQDRKALRRTAEEFDEDWWNCKHTGHMHSVNDKRLKAILAEFGGPVDLEDSDSGAMTRATMRMTTRMTTRIESEKAYDHQIHIHSSCRP